MPPLKPPPKLPELWLPPLKLPELWLLCPPELWLLCPPEGLLPLNEFVPLEWVTFLALGLLSICTFLMYLLDVPSRKLFLNCF